MARRTGYQTRNYAKGGAVKRTGYARGGDVGGEVAPTDAQIGRELDRYYRDPLAGRPAAPRENLDLDKNDAVYASTKPSWNDDAYNASMMASEQGEDYARGGVVRRNFADGGSVPGEWATKAQKAKYRAKLAERQAELDAEHGKGVMDAETGDFTKEHSMKLAQHGRAQLLATPGGRDALNAHLESVSGSITTHGTNQAVRGSDMGGVRGNDTGGVKAAGFVSSKDMPVREVREEPPAKPAYSGMGGEGKPAGRDITPPIQDAGRDVTKDYIKDLTPRETAPRDITPRQRSDATDIYPRDVGNDTSPQNVSYADNNTGSGYNYDGGGGGDNSYSMDDGSGGTLDVTSYDYGGGQSYVTDNDYSGNANVGGTYDNASYDGGGGNYSQASYEQPSYDNSSYDTSYTPSYSSGGDQPLPVYDGGSGGGGGNADGGYAEGGVVRRTGYDEGGVVDESAGLDTSYQGNTEAQDAALREQERQAREEAEAAARQRDELPVKFSDPPPTSAPSTGDNLSGYDPQIPPPSENGLDGQAILSSIMGRARSMFGIGDEAKAAPQTGYDQTGADEPPAPSPVREPGFLERAGKAIGVDVDTNYKGTIADATPPLQPQAAAGVVQDMSKANPTDSFYDLATSVPRKAVSNAADAVTGYFKPPALPEKGTFDNAKDTMADYLRGGKGMPLEQINKLIASQPTADLNTATQKAFNDLVSSGKTDDAMSMVQGLRPSYDGLRGLAQAAYDKGDAPTAMRALDRAQNNLPNGMRMSTSQTPDGGFQIQFAPEAGYKGQPRTENLSPQQFRDFLFGNGSQFDHAADNGLWRNLDILKQRNMEVPVTHTPGSPESIMEIRSRGGAFEDSGRYEANSPEARAMKMGLDPTTINAPGVREGLRPPSPEELAAPVPRDAAPVANAAPTSDVDEMSARRRSAAPRGGGGDGTTTTSTTTTRGGRSPAPAVGGAQTIQIQQTGFSPQTGTEEPGASTAGEPGSMMRGVPRGMGAAITSAELKYASQMPDRAITKDPELLQRLPDGYFDTMGGKAAIERIAREEASRGGQYPAGPRGKDAIASDLLSLYNPDRQRPAAPAGPESTAPIGPPAPSSEERIRNMMTPKGPYQAGGFDKDSAQSYNDRIAGMQGPRDPASMERGRQTEAKIAPQYQAAANQRTHDAAEKESAIQKQFRAEDAARAIARQREIEDATPAGIEHRRAMELQGAKNQPGFAKADATLGAANARSDAILTKTDRDNLTRQEIASGRNQTNRDIAGDRNQTNRDISTQRTDTQRDIGTQRTDTQKGIAANRDANRLQGIEMQQEGATARTTQREGGKDSRLEYTQGQLNQRAERVAQQKDQHQAFLSSKAAADIIQKDVHGDAKEVMTTVRTKIGQGIKLDANEMDVYQQVLDRAATSAPRTGGLFPALDPLRSPENRVQPQPAAMPAQGGAPVRVQSMEDARKLPSGSQFVGPDGILRRVN